MLDVLIRGGDVVDGTGRAARRDDVGLLDGRIEFVGQSGRERSAAVEVDAAGSIVCPGFIDVHSHSDLALIDDPLAGPKVKQGITTEVVGNCGWGVAPIAKPNAPDWRQASAGVLGSHADNRTWGSIGDYLAGLGDPGLGVNVATLVPHGAVRYSVRGMSSGPSSAREITQMRDMVERALADGAVGLSAGLVYPPGMFADTAELESLARTTAENDGLFAVHLRSYGRQLPAAVEEVLAIAERTHVRLHISHLSIIGRSNATQLDAVIDRIQAAQAGGLDVTFDQQPYPAASSTLSLLLPGWVLAGGTDRAIERLENPAERRKLTEMWTGEPVDDPFWENYVAHCGWDRILIGATTSGSAEDRALVGRSVAEVAAERMQAPADVAMDLWVQNRGGVTIVLLDLFPPATIERIFRQPLGMVATDAVVSAGLPHPRLYGTSARILQVFVRQLRLVALETAIHKMTGMPARRFGMDNRGLLRPGYAADVVVFSLDRIRDTATYHAPRASPEGIQHVFVNGRPAGQHGIGQVLRQAKKAVSA